MDQVEQDQVDWFHRLSSDEYLSGVRVIREQKGITDADIDQALSTLLEKGGKIGACVIVLVPTLQNESPNLPGPRSLLRVTIQAIDQPLFNLGSDGTGLSVSQIAERIRQIGHHFSTGRGNVYTFAAQDQIPVEVGKNSLGISFTRMAGDSPLPKVAPPAIALSSPTAPSTVTLTCATAGAAIRYTLDGSAPFESNASALVYSTPVDVAAAATVRAAATLTDYQASDISRKVIS